MPEPAIRDDWKTLPLPDPHSEVAGERLADTSYKLIGLLDQPGRS